VPASVLASVPALVLALVLAKVSAFKDKFERTWEFMEHVLSSKEHLYRHILLKDIKLSNNNK
jgi:hypothetical protein